MQQKRKIIMVILITSIFLVNMLYHTSFLPPSIIPTTENAELRTAFIAGTYQTFAYWTNVGDFVNWQARPDLGDAWTYYDDSGSMLHVKTGKTMHTSYATRDVPNLNTYKIHNFAFYVNHTNDWIAGGGISQFWLYGVYTDASEQQLAYHLMTTGGSNIAWYNGTFTTAKTLNYIKLKCYSAGDINTTVKIYDEIYKGYAPNITSYQTYTSVNLNFPQYFYVESDSSNTPQYLVLQYILTGNSKSIAMQQDWTQNNYFYTNYTLYREGVYLINYIVYNSWGIYTTTPGFTVYAQMQAYPAESYLNIRAYEYYDVPETLFYVYLGQLESETLFDFRERFGNWQSLGNVSWGYGYERIGFIGNPGGIKSDFAHIAPGRQYLLQNLTLEFDVRAPANLSSALVIILNPTKYDYDYLLNLSAEYRNVWVTVRIPIYMFQVFPSAGNTVGELGFYTGSELYELANIKLSTYHFSTMFINYTTQSYQTTQGNATLRYCYINISNSVQMAQYEELSFWYNFSDARANLYLQFYNGTWHTIANLTSTPLTYGLGNHSATTRFWQYWQNITLNNNYTKIRLYFTLKSPTGPMENVTVQVKRIELINLSSYRLESEVNRQRYDILTFDYQQETLLIVDFAGREVYRKLHNYSRYIDLYLNIAEISLENNLNYTCWFIFDSRGVELAYGVPAQSTRTIHLLLDDYWVKITRDNLTILEMRQVSITSTNKTTIKIGVKPPPIVYRPQGLLELLWEAVLIIWRWLTTDPWGIFVFVVLIIYSIYAIYRRIKNRRLKEVRAYKQGYSDGLSARTALYEIEDGKQERRTHILLGSE